MQGMRANPSRSSLLPPLATAPSGASMQRPRSNPLSPSLQAMFMLYNRGQRALHSAGGNQRVGHAANVVHNGGGGSPAVHRRSSWRQSRAAVAGPCRPAVCDRHAQAGIMRAVSGVTPMLVAACIQDGTRSGRPVFSCRQQVPLNNVRTVYIVYSKITRGAPRKKKARRAGHRLETAISCTANLAFQRGWRVPLELSTSDGMRCAERRRRGGSGGGGDSGLYNTPLHQLVHWVCAAAACLGLHIIRCTGECFREGSDPNYCWKPAPNTAANIGMLAPPTSPDQPPTSRPPCTTLPHRSPQVPNAKAGERSQLRFLSPRAIGTSFLRASHLQKGRRSTRPLRALIRLGTLPSTLPNAVGERRWEAAAARSRSRPPAGPPLCLCTTSGRLQGGRRFRQGGRLQRRNCHGHRHKAPPDGA